MHCHGNYTWSDNCVSRDLKSQNHDPYLRVEPPPSTQPRVCVIISLLLEKLVDMGAFLALIWEIKILWECDSMSVFGWVSTSGNPIHLEWQRQTRRKDNSCGPGWAVDKNWRSKTLTGSLCERWLGLLFQAVMYLIWKIVMFVIRQSVCCVEITKRLISLAFLLQWMLLFVMMSVIEKVQPAFFYIVNVFKCPLLMNNEFSLTGVR